MSNTDKLRLGLDIGGSSIKYGWGDCQQGLQHFNKIELQQRSLPCLKETVLAILQETDSAVGLSNIQAIGIGTPGTIDLASGMIAGVNPNLPFWVDHDPRELIPDNISLPVYSDNDANLMCLAEAWLRRTREGIVGVTVGSGIGCGFVSGGKVFRGSHGYAMELGHVTLVPDGEICGCGRRGCLEAYASVDAVRRRIISRPECQATLDPQCSLLQILRQRHLVPEVGSIIKEGEDALALGLSNLVVTLDPDVVVVGGGAMDAGMYDLQDLEISIKKLLPPQNRSRFKLEKALEGNRAGVLGALILTCGSDFWSWE